MDKTSARSSTPDLFLSAPAHERASSLNSLSPPSPNPSPSTPAITNTSSRHILPNDLPNAVKQLGDQELDRLLAAALAEQKRRGRKLPASDESSRKRKVEAVAAPLTQGKLNAVRAAFKAGVTPSRIARQFGISQSDVRKTLASDEPRR
jgi:hypothetical protein